MLSMTRFSHHCQGNEITDKYLSLCTVFLFTVLNVQLNQLWKAQPIGGNERKPSPLSPPPPPGCPFSLQFVILGSC